MARTKKLIIRLSEDEYDDIDYMAKLLKTSKAQVIRISIDTIKALCNSDLKVKDAIQEKYLDDIDDEIKTLPLIKLLKPFTSLLKKFKINTKVKHH